MHSKSHIVDYHTCNYTVRKITLLKMTVSQWQRRPHYMQWHTWTPAGFFMKTETLQKCHLSRLFRDFSCLQMFTYDTDTSLYDNLTNFTSYLSITSGKWQIGVLNTCRLVLCIRASLVICSLCTNAFYPPLAWDLISSVCSFLSLQSLLGRDHSEGT